MQLSNWIEIEFIQQFPLSIINILNIGHLSKKVKRKKKINKKKR